MVSKDWTFEQVQAEHDRVLAANPELSDADPKLPLFQWAALHQLDQYEGLFKDDGYWLMTAIRTCASHDLPMPRWVAKEFIKGYDQVNNARAKSWNTVFGLPYPKGSHLSAIRKKREFAGRIWLDIRNILNREPDTPIDEVLFESVGKPYGIGKTLASEYYYYWKQKFGF
ncbi:hypothetical protein [Methylobacillus flagellatus]|uniref:hypothetical protein n=1 Tax=Methylobacillus flagellatus TaxID=405 RepID=UPI0010F5A2B7|nr:hypothetical protein [Methylobacillus flagellatus]